MKKPKLAVVEKPAPGANPAPHWLSDAAREEWQRVAPVLAERGGLRPEIEGLLTAYCTALATVREADVILAREGLTVTGPSGPKVHPLVGPANRARAVALQLAKRLGLLSAAPAETKDNGKDDYSDLGIR